MDGQGCSGYSMERLEMWVPGGGTGACWEHFGEDGVPGYPVEWHRCSGYPMKGLGVWEPGEDLGCVGTLGRGRGVWVPYEGAVVCWVNCGKAGGELGTLWIGWGVLCNL